LALSLGRRRQHIVGRLVGFAPEQALEAIAQRLRRRRPRRQASAEHGHDGDFDETDFDETIVTHGTSPTLPSSRRHCACAPYSRPMAANPRLSNKAPPSGEKLRFSFKLRVQSL